MESAYRHIRFLPATQNDHDLGDKQMTGRDHPSVNLSGDDVRKFYESVVCDSENDKSTSQLNHVRRKRKTRGIVKSEKNIPKSDNFEDLRLKNRLLRSAQNDNLEDVKKCLNAGVCIDAKDEYGWTSLMCAAHSGADKVVRYLLAKCDRTCADREGRTAAGIALLANRITTYELIENYREERPVKAEPDDVFHCSVCDRNVTGQRNVHEASTAHQLTVAPMTRRTLYHLPEHNVGYQMLLRSGWCQDNGLGAEGQGCKYPVKTILRKTRACLGSDQKTTARITHSTEEISARPSRTVKKPNKSKGPEWERAVRSYMSTDY